jgi:putative tricarboxylic transport membrane protein
MLPIRRRTVLGGLTGLGAATLAGTASPLWAQTAAKTKLAAKVRIVIPAITRTTLDDSGRALGDAFVGMGLCDEVEYENRDGKGGIAGLAYFADKYPADPNAFFMGDTPLVGAIALQKPGFDILRLQPVARLTSDYLVVVVAAASPIKTVKELTEQLRTNPRQTVMAVGAAGGTDHVFAALLSKAAGTRPEDAALQSFTRSFEMVDAVLQGKATAGISGYSSFASDIASGKLRAIAVSAKRTLYGVRSAKEQGVDVDLTNWRAVFTGPAVAPARKAEMVEAVRVATTYDFWKKTLKENYWEPSWMAGPDLSGFIDLDSKTTLVMMQLLKLKA